jgi:hypothetical protein
MKDQITVVAIGLTDIQMSLAGEEAFDVEAIVTQTLETKWMALELEHEARVDAKRHSRLVRRLRSSIRQTVTGHLADQLAVRKGVKLRQYRPVPGRPGWWQRSRAFLQGEVAATRRAYDARLAILQVPRDVQLTLELFMEKHQARSAGQAEDAVYGT